MKHPGGTDVPRAQYDQRAILNFIVGYKQGHDGNSPTLREIMVEFGFNSTSGVSRALRSLEATGAIRIPPPVRGGGPARSIEVVGGKWQWTRMPAEAR